MTWRKWTLATVFFMLIALGARSQNLDDALDETLQVNVDLVVINASVTDQQNRIVTGLESEHFQLFEDQVEQQIEYFSAEDVPLSLGIVFDVSGSMKDKLSVARDAAATFLETGSPEDEYFLVEFSSSPEITQSFTTDIGRLQNQIVFTPAGGMTALYDAVYLGLERLNQGANTKKALLLITDGEDNKSRYTFSNVREFVRESDVQIYSIGIVNTYNSQLAAGRTGRALIEELSEVTGGRAFFPNSVHELEDITTKIAIELKNQYILGYVSTNQSSNGEWRDVDVKMDPPRGLPRLTVRARKGYYAPVQ